MGHGDRENEEDGVGCITQLGWLLACFLGSAARRSSGHRSTGHSTARPRTAGGEWDWEEAMGEHRGHPHASCGGWLRDTSIKL
jgi:hypothetical protein